MVKIAEINAQNPWWNQGETFMRYDQSLTRAKPIFFERNWIEIEKGGIALLRGPRQVGKTTYLKHAVRKLLQKGVPARDILYLSLDFFTSRRELRNTINHIFETRRDAPHLYLFLDEITSFEDWNLELKYLSDQGVLRKGSVMATGSIAIKLKQKVELLPGRGLEGNEYYVTPLNFRAFVLQTTPFLCQNLSDDEFTQNLDRLKSVLSGCVVDLSSDYGHIAKTADAILPFKRELAYLFRLYLITGGLPGVINHYLSNRFIENLERMEQTVSEIYIRDILGDLHRLQKQESITRQILKAIIDRYGSRYSFSRLARQIEATHVTTIDYLEYLEEAFIAFVLYAYDFNTKDIKTKGDKKVYFFDPFVFHSVRSYLGGIHIWELIQQSMEDEDWLGKLVEGIVIGHLRSHGEIPFLKTSRTFIWFYYDKSGKEMDSIYKSDSTFLGLEVKFQSQVDLRDIRRIAPVKQYIILSREDVSFEENMTMLPVDVFLALLPSSNRHI